MARGELSYSKVRALTRVATPEIEEAFLMLALHGTAHHVEKLVRYYRRAQEAAELTREAQQFADRRATYFYDDDGSLVIQARLPAETFLKNGYQAPSGGERQQIVVHVDEQTLNHGTPGRCELDYGPALAAQTARRLSCDASIVRIVEDEDGHALDIGRKTRSIPPAIRRALRARDDGCRFPGCTHTRFLDGHHIQHWANGGATKLSNLVMLCRFHHRQVHEGNVNVQALDDGSFRFTGARGKCFEAAVASTGNADVMRAQHARCGIHVNADTAVTRWGGESMDYSIAVGGLLDRYERARNVAAATS